MLSGTTEFNPYFRFSARELIKNKYFEDIRITKIEKPSSSKVMLEVDQDECFDYEEGKSLKFNRQDYMRMILEEVNKVHALRL